MGSYEFLSGACFGDITGLSDEPDCAVDVNDLLAVINQWGACDPQQPCSADVAASCGTVDVNDLLAIINNWGACEGLCLTGTTPSVPSELPESIEDCMELANQRCGENEACWLNTFELCVEALCEAEIIECE
jgi:hypothetical protein